MLLRRTLARWYKVAAATLDAIIICLPRASSSLSSPPSILHPPLPAPQGGQPKKTAPQRSKRSSKPACPLPYITSSSFLPRFVEHSLLRSHHDTTPVEATHYGTSTAQCDAPRAAAASRCARLCCLGHGSQRLAHPPICVVAGQEREPEQLPWLCQHRRQQNPQC